MRRNFIFRPHHFLQILANYVDNMFIHCFYDPKNFFSKCFENAADHKFCSNFAIIDATKGSKSFFKRFLKKKLLVPRNTKAIKKHNGVILLPWQLWCQYNMDHNKCSSLYNTTVATFFRYLCQCRRSKRLKWESILPKKSSRATLMKLQTRKEGTHSCL